MGFVAIGSTPAVLRSLKAGSRALELDTSHDWVVRYATLLLGWRDADGSFLAHVLATSFEKLKNIPWFSQNK